MNLERYASLNDIRREKMEEKRHLEDDVRRLKNDVTDYFVPANNVFLNSSNKYMNYIGYAITAYKTAMTFKGVFRFFLKWI